MIPFKAVLFDLDGVIVDSMPLHADSWIKIFREYGVDLTRTEVFMREGMSGIASVIDIFRDRGLPVPDEKELGRLLEKKLAMFENHTIRLFPRVMDILNLLKDHSVPMALVTGSLRRTVEHELSAELRSFFGTIVTIEDVRRGKPDPDPYLQAAASLGVDPGKSLVVENAPMGVLSAKRAGAWCAAVETTLSREHLAEADMICADHDELYSFLFDRLEHAR